MYTWKKFLGGTITIIITSAILYLIMIKPNEYRPQLPKQNTNAVMANFLSHRGHFDPDSAVNEIKKDTSIRYDSYKFSAEDSLLIIFTNPTIDIKDSAEVVHKILYKINRNYDISLSDNILSLILSKTPTKKEAKQKGFKPLFYFIYSKRNGSVGYETIMREKLLD